MRRSESREVLVSLLAVLGSAGVVATCSASRPAQDPSTIASASASVRLLSSPPASISVESESVADPVPAPAADSTNEPTGPSPDKYGVSPEGNPIPRLPRFYASLDRLKQHRADKHVRVLWLGDSHSQADFWTHEVRRELQQRFGNGGPGFVHIAWPHDSYRHEGVRVQSQGSFAIVPAKLVSQEPVGDGVFGLGGVRMTPKAGGSMASLEVSSDSLPGKSTWDLAFRFTDTRASMRVSLAGGNAVTLRAGEPDSGPPGALRHKVLEAKGPGGRLEVSDFAGMPELMGVVIESAEGPGLVLDTLGLNGARYTTALAYDESTWVSEVSRRAPSLIVAAFGTNESSNTKFRPESHKRAVASLISRAMRASPGSDCLIFGPVDRGGADYSAAIERLNEAQRQAAAELGCAFWDGQKAMGGKLSIEDWLRAKPALAASDRIHLSRNGYIRIGAMLARDILKGYGVWAGRDDASPEARGGVALPDAGTVVR